MRVTARNEDAELDALSFLTEEERVTLLVAIVKAAPLHGHPEGVPEDVLLDQFVALAKWVHRTRVAHDLATELVSGGVNAWPTEDGDVRLSLDDTRVR